MEKIGAERVNQPIAPGKWSPREIACHLADCELAFSFRLRQSLAEDGHVMQPFDQDRWAANYPAYEAARRAGGIFRGTRMERGAAALAASGSVRAESEPSGTRRDDFSNHCRNYGRARSEPFGAVSKSKFVAARKLAEAEAPSRSAILGR